MRFAALLSLAGCVAPSATVIERDAGVPLPTFGAYNSHVAEIEGTYYASFLDHGFARIVASDDRGATWEDVLPAKKFAADQGPALAADGRLLYAVWSHRSRGHLPRIRGRPVEGYAEMGPCEPKFSLVAGRDVLFWSRREGGDLHLVTLDPSGHELSNVVVERHLGTWGTPGEYRDPHYHTMHVDEEGALHLLYTMYRWPEATKPESYAPIGVHYRRTRDRGATWEAEAVVAENAWGASVAAIRGEVHVLYFASGLIHSQLGGFRKRVPFSMHSVLIRDGEDLYLFGECDGHPSLARNGFLVHQLDRVAENDGYFAAPACPRVTSDGAIVGVTTDYSKSGPQGVLFVRFPVR